MWQAVRGNTTRVINKSNRLHFHPMSAYVHACALAIERAEWAKQSQSSIDLIKCNRISSDDIMSETNERLTVIINDVDIDNVMLANSHS